MNWRYLVLALLPLGGCVDSPHYTEEIQKPGALKVKQHTDSTEEASKVYSDSEIEQYLEGKESLFVCTTQEGAVDWKIREVELTGSEDTMNREFYETVLQFLNPEDLGAYEDPRIWEIPVLNKEELNKYPF